MIRSPLAFLALVLCLTSCSRSDPSLVEASYVPPTLSGWQLDEPKAGEKNFNNTTYTKAVGDSRVRMMFKVIPLRPDEAPDDLASLKRYAQKGLSSAKKTSPSTKVLNNQETTFRSFPAVLTITQGTNNGSQLERKVLRVADGKNTFLIDQTLVGDPISADARKEADSAWNKISNELKIPDGS